MRITILPGGGNCGILQHISSNRIYLLFDLIKFLDLALSLGGRDARRFAPGCVPVVGGDVTASPGIPDDVTGGRRVGDFASVRRRSLVE